MIPDAHKLLYTDNEQQYRERVLEILTKLEERIEKIEKGIDAFVKNNVPERASKEVWKKKEIARGLVAYR